MLVFPVVMILGKAAITTTTKMMQVVLTICYNVLIRAGVTV